MDMNLPVLSGQMEVVSSVNAYQGIMGPAVQHQVGMNLSNVNWPSVSPQSLARELKAEVGKQLKLQ